MVIREFRIPMPLSVEEYRRAQLYMVSRFSRERTTKGEGVEIVKNEPYEDANGKGQFTHKIIHIGSHIPVWLKYLIPGSMTTVEEKSWNAYPYVRTEYTCPFFGERFSILSETKYYDDDDGKQENVFGLSDAALKERQVESIDIVSEEVNPQYYKPEEDPKIFKSVKTGRGQLKKDWQKTGEKPQMMIYKLQTVKFQYWGMQGKVEQWIMKSMVRDVLLLGHKQAFCWMDEWFDLTIDDLRKIEEETKQLLDKIRSGEVENKDAILPNEIGSEPSTPISERKKEEGS